MLGRALVTSFGRALVNSSRRALVNSSGRALATSSVSKRRALERAVTSYDGDCGCSSTPMLGVLVVVFIWEEIKIRRTRREIKARIEALAAAESQEPWEIDLLSQKPSELDLTSCSGLPEVLESCDVNVPEHKSA